MGKYFGTDGVRGIAGKELTNDLAYRLGRYGAYVLTQHSPKEKAVLVIGKDTRVSSYMLEASLIAGILSVGCDVVMVGVIPTPGIAHLVREEEFDAGIMISASHNSFEYNGIKFFNHEGYKLTDDIEDEIETYLNGERSIEKEYIGAEIGRMEWRKDLREKYIHHAASLCHEDLSTLRILIDTANGATHKMAPRIYTSCGIQIDQIFNEPNGININDHCGSTHLETLAQEVVKGGYDFGLAFDGDGDRVLAIDHLGREVDGDKIMAICSHYLREREELDPPVVVATVMSNLGFMQYMKQHGFDVLQSAVGDRYVLEKMVEGGYHLGGEQSGHIILLDKNTTGDGIQTGLLLSNALVHSGKSLAQWNDEIPKYPQALVNVRVARDKVKLFEEVESANRKREEIEALLEGNGRILIRPSGTEPLLRVMIEGPDQEKIEAFAKELAELYGKELS